MKSRHAQVPEGIIGDRAISHGAFRLYVGIAFYANKGTKTAFPAISTLCRLLGGADRRQVQRWLNELVDGAYVVRSASYGEKGKRQANTYRLPHHPEPLRAAAAVETTAGGRSFPPRLNPPHRTQKGSTDQGTGEPFGPTDWDAYRADRDARIAALVESEEVTTDA